MTPLTWLYVPADRPDRVAKALASRAHAVIVDLEDAVAPAAKDEARASLRELFANTPAVWVHIRVNGIETQWGEDDLRAAAALPVHGVTLPKTERGSETAVALSLRCTA
jgi:citrate lyase subunit beta/citryl-CoA lyase